jgi:RNA polymerase subunit RPABC4/transcription elongation factor Spt4
MPRTACPLCGVALDRQEDFCPHCGEAFSERRRRKALPPGDRPFAAPLAGISEDEKRCPECLTSVDQTASFCPTCGTRFAAYELVKPTATSSTSEAPSARVDTLPAGAWLALAGGILMAVGSFLPWMQASAFFVTLHRNGMQMGDNMGFSVDGVVTLVLGVFTCVIGLSRLLHFSMPSFLYRSSVATGLIAGAITVYDATQIHTFVASIGGENVAASLGYGLWVLLVGAALAILGGFVVRLAAKPFVQPVTVAKVGDETITPESTAAVAPAMDAPPKTSVLPTMSVADELSKLAALLDRGLLTQEEFAAQKARLLG